MRLDVSIQLLRAKEKNYQLGWQLGYTLINVKNFL